MSPRVFFSLETARGQFGPCALSIGNFDGVHTGHQALLAFAQRYASNLRVSPAVLTFHPHPAVFVAPHRVPEMICGLEERLRRLSAAGAERILVLPFNHEVARLTAEEFVSKIVVGGLQAKAVFVGENFRFGYQRAGGPQTLERLGEHYGFTAHFIKAGEVSRTRGLELAHSSKSGGGQGVACGTDARTLLFARGRGGLGPGRGSEANRADGESARDPGAIDTARRVRDRNVRDFERAALALDYECGQPADVRRRAN